MTSTILHSRRHNCQYKVCYALGFYVSADFFFAFFGAEKDVFHIAPFRPTRYVLKSFRYLEVRYRVRNWYKFKKFIFVGSKLSLFQLEIPISIYKIMCQSTLINTVSFLFCEFIRVTSWNDGKTIIFVRSSFQIPK